MPTPTKQVRQAEKKRNARAKTLANAINRWMLRLARDEAKKAIAKDVEGKVEKAAPNDPFMRELYDILMRFGIAQGGDEIRASASGKDLKKIVDPRNLQRETESKEFKLKWFHELDKWATKRVKDLTGESKKMVKASVNRILRDAANEKPQPSVGEIARRIRTQLHGVDPQKRMYAFSPERAAIIARTETGQIQESARAKVFQVAGVKRIRWLAYPNDGRSGDRQHYLMHKKEVDFGEMFTTPLGNQLRFPHDPQGPIKETINCRCTYRAVVVDE